MKLYAVKKPTTKTSLKASDSYSSDIINIDEWEKSCEKVDSEMEQEASEEEVSEEDSDSDGYPDWFEWSNNAGEQDNFYYLGSSGYSDPHDPYIVPYTLSNVGDTVFYTKRDGYGPQTRTSGWYYGAEPGNYNWDVAEEFIDVESRYGLYKSNQIEFMSRKQ